MNKYDNYFKFRLATVQDIDAIMAREICLKCYYKG